MSNSVLFRTSLSGYNKKDVNDYLASRAKETEKLLSQKDALIASLEGKSDSVLGEIRKDADTLNAQLNEVKDQLRELLRQLELADEEIRKASEYAAKAEKFDRLAATLGDVLSLDTKKEASAEGESPAAPLTDRSSLKAGVTEALAKTEKTLNALKAKTAAE